MKHIVRGVSPRLLGTGLLSSSANSSGVRIMGVIAQNERAVSLIPQRMIEGTYLTESSPASSVVIGAELAHKLEVKIGSKVVLMTQSLRPPGSDSKGWRRKCDAKHSFARERDLPHRPGSGRRQHH